MKEWVRVHGGGGETKKERKKGEEEVVGRGGELKQRK